MTHLDAATLQRFLALAGDRLTGSWVVIGGCVLPLLGIEHRVTYDIDVAGPDEADMRQMRILLEIAEKLGLPMHAINHTGSFLLHEGGGWQRHNVELHRGSSATLHVPDATLFLLLKLRRLSESDLGDCRVMVERARRLGADIDADRIRAVTREHLERAPSPTRAERLQQLLELVGDPA